ncbi:MAG: T9SS type A sorting domain-containing protein [Bacteroides sp.]|nr:T9SS type A sorting domain-containing protein [Bacteroides sp.]
MLSPRQIFAAFIILISVNVSSQTYVSGEIAVNTTWTKAASPYVILDSVIVGTNAVLTLDFGTTVMFKYHPLPASKSYMVINGGIKSNGNFENFVVFTSDRDKSVMDLYGDGNATIPRAGDWGFIHFNNLNPSEGEHGLDWTEFRYGGGRNPDTISSPEFYPTLTFRDEIHNDYNTMWMRDCAVNYSKGVGIRMGNVLITNAYISGCTHGIQVTSSTCGLTSSTITGNTGYPILFDGLKVCLDYDDSESSNYFIEAFSGNNISNNGLNYFAVGGNVELIKGDAIPGPMTFELDWRKLSIPYMVTSPLKVSGLEINLERGTLIKFKYFEEPARKPYILFDSESILRMQGGISGEKTVFTSEYDHRYDYEPFEGKHRDPMAGDWGYMEAYNFDLEDCVFKYGGLYADPATGDPMPGSSGVVRIMAGLSGSSHFTGCLFNSLYRHGIVTVFEPSTNHQISINNSSFLLSKENYGISSIEPEGESDLYIDARNNYWNGRMGPYNPKSETMGNGCRVGDNIDYKPFLTESDDELDLVSSVLLGTVLNLDGEIIPGALVRLKGKKEKSVYSKDDGSYYISNVHPGYGYKLHTFARLHRDTLYEDITIGKDTSHVWPVHLRARTIDYQVDTITFQVNPPVSEIQVGGIAYRYYKIVDKTTHDPVYGAEVFVEGLVDTFYTNYKGIATISIPWDKAGSSSAGKQFYISQVGIEALPYPADQRMYFSVKRISRDYTKMWGGKLWMKEGISIVELKQEAGASLGVVVANNGSGGKPVSLVLERGFQAGAGINLGASAKAKLGPIEAGAEAEVGVNLNAVMGDQFIFDYENNEGSVALAKFIVLAGSAFQYLDSPLHRYLGVALLDDNPHVQQASFSNSIGLNYNGYAGAKAGVGLTLKDDDGKESPIGAELKGSAEAKGNIDFLFTSYTHSDQLDFKLSYAAEIGLGVSAGVGFDIAKLFGDGDEKDKNDKATNDKNKKDDNEFKIEIPELLSGKANAGIKYGASISTTREVPQPFTSLDFMYGYKYAAGVSAFSLFGAGVGQDREFHFTFDFYDSYLKGIVEEKVQLAKDLVSTDMSNLSLDISSLSGASIFESPFAIFAAEQTKNAFSYPPVPYTQNIKDLVDQGEFAVEISFGLGPIKCKFGAGIEYNEVNDYLWRSGVFYDWGLYPLQTYDYVAQNNDIKVGPILQDILDESGAYLWDEFISGLIPEIFKKIPIWPFSLLKGTNAYEIPVGPDSRSSYLAVDKLSSSDSLFVYYWDWYGTEGISKEKAAMDTKSMQILEHVKSMAVEVHKLDYGIGGFYQFEPNGLVVGDSTVLSINYDDTELDVLLKDSTAYTIDESDLRMYVEDKTNHKWIYIGGEVDPVNNLVTARIDSLATFTLAPFTPDGEMILTANPDTIHVEILDSTVVSSNTIYYNTGEVVRDEEFTIQASKGSILTPDANAGVEGVQILSMNGKISFAYRSDSISGIAYLKASSRKGRAEGITSVAIYEENPPETPVITSAILDDYSVELKWEPVPDPDLASYMVYYGTQSGAPYVGTASVAGEDSPVKAGTANSIRLDGLYKDSTYYFAIRAMDRVGNVSEYSNEVKVTTQFNRQPVIYARVFNIYPGMSNGMVIDTLWARDEDRDQSLKYYLAANNTCTAFDLDPMTGEITVKDAAQLDYWATGIDSFLMHVGVRDNGLNPLADSTEIRIILNFATGMRRAPLPHEPLFMMYPNPAADLVHIELIGQEISGEKSISIVNLQGQTFYREAVADGAVKHFQIDLSRLPSGLYSVLVQTGNGKAVQRLVLIR